MKRILLLAVLFAIFVVISAFSYVNALTEGIASNILRIHVIANSDEDGDQRLKYMVRDGIIDHIEEMTDGHNRRRRHYGICATKC